MQPSATRIAQGQVRHIRVAARIGPAEQHQLRFGAALPEARRRRGLGRLQLGHDMAGAGGDRNLHECGDHTDDQRRLERVALAIAQWAAQGLQRGHAHHQERDGQRRPHRHHGHAPTH
ncbi:hypothetical protein D3C78_1229160 [compost metagenome]